MSLEPGNFSKHPNASRKYWTVFFSLLALFLSILGYSIFSVFSGAPSPPAASGVSSDRPARVSGAPASPRAPGSAAHTPSAPRAAQADVDFGPYMADLQRRIKRAWFPPKGEESKRVVVIFKVMKDGSLSNLRLDHSSGVKIADEAALRAVENASPFKPLPAGSSDNVDIQFTFDYNVFNGSGHGKFKSF